MITHDWGVRTIAPGKKEYVRANHKKDQKRKRLAKQLAAKYEEQGYGAVEAWTQAYKEVNENEN